EAVVVGRTARARLRERLRQLGRQVERGARAVGLLREVARRELGLVGGRRRGRRLGGDTDRRRRRRRRARRRGRSLRGGRRAQRGVVGGPARRAEAGGGGVVAGGGRVRGPGPRRIVERGRGEVERVGRLDRGRRLGLGGGRRRRGRRRRRLGRHGRSRARRIAAAHRDLAEPQQRARMARRARQDAAIDRLRLVQQALVEVEPGLLEVLLDLLRRGGRDLLAGGLGRRRAGRGGRRVRRDALGRRVVVVGQLPGELARRGRLRLFGGGHGRRRRLGGGVLAVEHDVDVVRRSGRRRGRRPGRRARGLRLARDRRSGLRARRRGLLRAVEIELEIDVLARTALRAVRFLER